MPSTIAHALFPSTTVVITGKKFPPLNRLQWGKFILLSAFLGNSPDLDLIPSSLLPSQWENIHRFWGHNIFAVAALSGIGSWLIRRFISKSFSVRQSLIISSLLVMSHLLLDSMGDFAPDGRRPSIPFFYPFSTWAFYLPWKLFPCSVLKTGVHPFLAHLLSIDFWTKVVFVEVATSLLLAGTIGSFFLVTAKMRKKIGQLHWLSKLPESSQSALPHEPPGSQKMGNG